MKILYDGSLLPLEIFKEDFRNQVINLGYEIVELFGKKLFCDIVFTL